MVIVSLHLIAEASGKGPARVQTAAELRLRSGHNHRFLFLGPEDSHLSGSSLRSELVLFLLDAVLLVHLLLSHELDRVLHPLMDLLLAVEATHAAVLDLDLGLALLGLLAVLGVDVDVALADLALGLAVEDAVPALGLGVAAALLLLPHLPEFLELDDLVLLRPAVLVGEVFNQASLVLVIVVLELDLLRLLLDLVEDYLYQDVCLIFIQVAQFDAALDVVF